MYRSGQCLNQYDTQPKVFNYVTGCRQQTALVQDCNLHVPGLFIA